MKKLLSIILCLCVMVIPLNVVALDLPETSVITDISDDEVITAPIIEITPSDDSPEAQAIAKIHAHMRANGEEPVSTMAQASGLIDGGIYNIKNYFSGKYLNVCYGTDANGTNVYQYTKDGSDEQQFKVVYDSSTDSYKLYAMCSSNGNNRVIDVKRGGAALASGQNVDIWTPVDHTAQRVEITYLTYNIYHIRMKANTGLYLTTRDSSNGTKAGTSATSPGNVHINSFDVNLNQQWAFEYLGTATPEPEPEPEPATPTGSLDVVNANVISGWAWRSDLPNSPINVNIQVIGSNGITYLNTTVSANEYNSTIYNTGYGNGYHGFSYNFDFLAVPSQTYTIYAYGIGADGSYTQLVNSPWNFVWDNSCTINFVSHQQDRTSWCWAATALMLGQNIYPESQVTQEDIVRYVTGNYYDDEAPNVGGDSQMLATGASYAANNQKSFITSASLSFNEIRTILRDGYLVEATHDYELSAEHSMIIFGYEVVFDDDLVTPIYNIKYYEPTYGDTYTVPFEEFQDSTYYKNGVLERAVYISSVYADY